MAVCEIWDVRGRLDHPIDYVKNPEKTANPRYTDGDLQALRDVMKYIGNCNKTVNQGNESELEYFISGVNCDPACARDEMMIAKAQWGDESEIVCYHGFQSFKEGEVTPELAHKIGVELAERMWGDRFQVVVATHLNTKCFHNHFVLNSVSFTDGKHYPDNKKNLAIFRKKSDELCRKYRLSVITNPKGRKKPYGLYKAEKTGLPTRDTIARAAVDEAIEKSFTIKDFVRRMREAGYSVNVNPNRKYWTIQGEGWDRAKRLYLLGDDYTNERIIERIRENSYLVAFARFAPAEKEHRRYKVGGRRKSQRKVGGLRGLYLHYCYRLGILPKGKMRDPKKVHRLLRDDLLKLEHITNETRLLCRRQIDTMEQLFSYRESLLQEKGELQSRRKVLYAKSRKAVGKEKGCIRTELSEIAGRMKVIRKEEGLCEGIMERSRMISDRLSAIRKEEQERKGEKENVCRGRCSRADGKNEPARG